MDEDIDELLDYGEDNIHTKDKEENTKNNIINHNDKENDKLYYFDDVEIDTKKNDTKPKTDNDDIVDLLESDDEKKKFDDLLDSNEPTKKDFGSYFNSKKQKSSIFDDLDNEKEMNDENIDNIPINDNNDNFNLNEKKEEDNKLNDSNEVVDQINYDNNVEKVDLIDNNEDDNNLNKSNEVDDEFNYDNNDFVNNNDNENIDLNDKKEDDNIFNNSNDNISNKSNENKENNENIIEDNNNNQDDDVNKYNDFEDEGTFITGTNVLKNKKTEKVETGIDTNDDTISKKNLSKNPSLASTIKKKNNSNNTNYYKSNYSMNKKSLNPNRKLLSNYDKAEILYLKIKNDIDKIIQSNITNEFDLSRENAKMFSLFSQLNKITNLITDGTKLNIKSKYNNNNSIKENEQISDPSINNEKIINRYENEYNKLQNKIKKFKNPELEEKLEIEKRKITNDIIFYEKENHNLKQLQKINEYRFERQLKNPNTRQIQLKRFENEYEKLKKDYDKVVNNIEKNKQRQKDYDAKLEELKNFKKRIEELAKDMYNITEFKKVDNTEKEEKEKKKLKENLEKKLQILESAFGTNKSRYENAISKKEKIIFEKEKEKLDTLKDLKMESSKNEKLKVKINEIYEPIIQMQNEELKAKEEEKKVRELLKKQNEIEQEKMRLLQEENYRRLQEERNNNIKKEEKKVIIQNNNLNNYNIDLNNKVIQNDNINNNKNNNYYNNNNYENKKPIENINQNINNYENKKPIENINKSPILNDKKEYILINKNKKEERFIKNDLINYNNIIEKKGVLPPVQIGKGRKPNFNFKLNDLVKNEKKDIPISLINNEKNITNPIIKNEKEKENENEIEKQKKFEEIKEENENEIENTKNNVELNKEIQNKFDKNKKESKLENNFDLENENNNDNLEENEINNDNKEEKEENNLKDLELDDNKNVEMFLEKEELPSNIIRKNYQEKIENPKIENQNEQEENFYIEKEEQDDKNLIEEPIKTINKDKKIEKQKNNEDNILNTSGISSIKNEGNNIEDENLNKKLSEHNFSKENIELEKEEDEFTKMFKRRMNQEEVIQKEGPLIRDKVKEEAFNALLQDDIVSEFSKNNKKETNKKPIDDFDNLEDFIL